MGTNKRYAAHYDRLMDQRILERIARQDGPRQSWSQGVQVWGRDGMWKLWSASNVAVCGGGVKEPEFLNELSQMIGDYDRRTTSTRPESRGVVVFRARGVVSLTG